MPVSSFYETKFYTTDLCWVCHKLLNSPLHAMERAQLGMRRVHHKCFDFDLFAKLQANFILSVSEDDRVTEHVLPYRLDKAIMDAREAKRCSDGDD